MRTLERAARCHFCGDALPIGAVVQWYRTSAIQGGSRARGVAARNVPCCDGKFAGECTVKAREAERAVHDAKLADLTNRVATLVAAGNLDGALALLSGGK